MSKISVITQLQVTAYVAMYFLKITFMANVTAEHPIVQNKSTHFKIKPIKSNITKLILNDQF